MLVLPRARTTAEPERKNGPLVAVTMVGVLVGTLVGEHLLLGLSRDRFRIVVSVAVGLLGLWFLLGSV